MESGAPHDCEADKGTPTAKQKTGCEAGAGRGGKRECDINCNMCSDVYTGDAHCCVGRPCRRLRI
eukprot:8848623-Pyramimonas_sp.AAC.1